MTVEILTPDELLYKGEVYSAIFPGISGEFGILDNHAAMISALKKGNVSIKKEANSKAEGKYAEEHMAKSSFDLAINGGTVEVSKNKVLVLAE